MEIRNIIKEMGETMMEMHHSVKSCVKYVAFHLADVLRLSLENYGIKYGKIL